MLHNRHKTDVSNIIAHILSCIVIALAVRMVWGEELWKFLIIRGCEDTWRRGLWKRLLHQTVGWAWCLRWGRRSPGGCTCRRQSRLCVFIPDVFKQPLLWSCSHLSLISWAAARTDEMLLVSSCSSATWAAGCEASRAERAACARRMFLQARHSCSPSASWERRRSHSARPMPLKHTTRCSESSAQQTHRLQRNKHYVLFGPFCFESCLVY